MSLSGGLSAGLVCQLSASLGGGGAAAAQNPGDLTDGLLAFYRFDGNGNDSSGNAINLPTTGATFDTGLIGQALTAYNTNTSVSWGVPLSISFWFQVGPDREEQSPQCAFDFSGSDIYAAVSSRNVDTLLIIWMGTGVFFESTDATEWAHVIVTVATDGGSSIYVNGNLEATQTPYGYGPAEMFVVETNKDYTGKLDLVGIWGRVLSSDEIATLYNGGAGFDPTA